jgi:hypothetical protein
MLKPLDRFDETWNEPKFYIEIRKVWPHYEWYVDNILVFKDTKKGVLMKDLNNYCKDLLKKQKEWLQF